MKEYREQPISYAQPDVDNLWIIRGHIGDTLLKICVNNVNKVIHRQRLQKLVERFIVIPHTKKKVLIGNLKEARFSLLIFKEYQ